MEQELLKSPELNRNIKVKFLSPEKNSPISTISTNTKNLKSNKKVRKLSRHSYLSQDSRVSGLGETAYISEKVKALVKILNLPPTDRVSDDLSIIKKYLMSLPSFVKFIDSIKENQEASLLMIMTYLKHKSNPIHSLVFKFGDRGESYYIILSGKVEIVLAKPEQTSMTKSDYYNYLIKLMNIGEFEVYKSVLNLNASIFKFSDKEMEFLNDTENYLTKGVAKGSMNDVNFIQFKGNTTNLDNRASNLSPNIIAPSTKKNNMPSSLLNNLNNNDSSDEDEDEKEIVLKNDKKSNSILKGGSLSHSNSILSALTGRGNRKTNSVVFNNSESPIRKASDFNIDDVNKKQSIKDISSSRKQVTRHSVIEKISPMKKPTKKASIMNNILEEIPEEGTSSKLINRNEVNVSSVSRVNFDTTRKFTLIKKQSTLSSMSKKSQFRKMEITVSEYINACIPDPPLISKNKEEEKLVTILKYHSIVSLGPGSTFGEVALLSEFNKRSATCICTENTEFGILNKTIYNKCIRKADLAVYKRSMYLMTNNILFHNFSRAKFKKYIFDNIGTRKVMKGNYLIHEGTNQDENIYFIKSGQFSYHLNTNLINLRNIYVYFKEMNNAILSKFPFIKKHLCKDGVVYSDEVQLDNHLFNDEIDLNEDKEANKENKENSKDKEIKVKPSSPFFKFYKLIYDFLQITSKNDIFINNINDEMSFNHELNAYLSKKCYFEIKKTDEGIIGLMDIMICSLKSDMNEPNSFNETDKSILNKEMFNNTIKQKNLFNIECTSYEGEVFVMNKQAFIQYLEQNSSLFIPFLQYYITKTKVISERIESFIKKKFNLFDFLENGDYDQFIKSKYITKKNKNREDTVKIISQALYSKNYSIFAKLGNEEKSKKPRKTGNTSNASSISKHSNKVKNTIISPYEDRKLSCFNSNELTTLVNKETINSVKDNKDTLISNNCSMINSPSLPCFSSISQSINMKTLCTDRAIDEISKKIKSFDSKNIDFFENTEKYNIIKDSIVQNYKDIALAKEILTLKSNKLLSFQKGNNSNTITKPSTALSNNSKIDNIKVKSKTLNNFNKCYSVSKYAITMNQPTETYNKRQSNLIHLRPDLSYNKSNNKVHMINRNIQCVQNTFSSIDFNKVIVSSDIIMNNTKESKDQTDYYSLKYFLKQKIDHHKIYKSLNMTNTNFYKKSDKEKLKLKTTK